MTKLSMEQRESLSDIHESGNWEAVLALAQISLEHHQVRVLTADITKNDRDVAILRAKHDGAKDMLLFLTNIREHINGVKKKT